MAKKNTQTSSRQKKSVRQEKELNTAKERTSVIDRAKKKRAHFLERRPHRSFRLTKRRDTKRPLKLPGYIRFTKEVTGLVWKYRKQFLLLATVYAVVAMMLVGITSQETITQLREILKSGDSQGSLFVGAWGEVGKTALLSLNLLGGGALSATNEAQQIYAALAVLFLWLTTIWLLRHNLAGDSVRLRDGIYNAGAPIIATAIISFIIVLQLIPVAIVGIAYSAGVATGFLDGGVEAMLFWIAAGGLTVLSLYWILSSFFALVIVTIPGTYPFRAIRIAGDVAVGRRLGLLMRLTWMLVFAAVGTFLCLFAVSFVDRAIKALVPALEWLPIIPVVFLFVSAAVLIWITAYVYLLYRKVMAYDAETGA